MSRWEALIVSPDAGAASWQCRLIAAFAGVRPAGVATTAPQAEALIESLRPDLVILDLNVGPDSLDGLTLLHRIRATPVAVEVIALTAAPDGMVVRHALRLGVLDVLLKPVAPARLHKSIGVFSRQMGMLANPIVAQEQLDCLCSNGPNAHRWIPRDLADERLRQVREALAGADAPTTAVLVAGQVGIAPVTARRYLEYLVSTGEAFGGRSMGRPGRPANLYALADRYRSVVA